MGKCWMVESENEMDDDFLKNEMEALPEDYHAKVSAFPSNPLEPIMEVWEKHKSDLLRRANYQSITWPVSREMAKAIQKCREIMEGKK